MKFTQTALATMSLLASSAKGFAFVSNRAGSRVLQTASTTSSRFQAARSFQSSPTAMKMSNIEEFVKTSIDSAPVVVFSKTTCPFCMATKELFDDLDIDYKAVEINKIEDGIDVQMELAEMTGQRTVPNVFIKGEHIGGNDDTQALAKSGKLQELLAN